MFLVACRREVSSTRSTYARLPQETSLTSQFVSEIHSQPIPQFRPNHNSDQPHPTPPRHPHLFALPKMEAKQFTQSQLQCQKENHGENDPEAAKLPSRIQKRKA